MILATVPHCCWLDVVAGVVPPHTDVDIVSMGFGTLSHNYYVCNSDVLSLGCRAHIQKSEVVYGAGVHIHIMLTEHSGQLFLISSIDGPLSCLVSRPDPSDLP